MKADRMATPFASPPSARPSPMRVKSTARRAWPMARKQVSLIWPTRPSGPVPKVICASSRSRATDPQGNGGISLLLDAVIVTDAQYGGDGLEDDFEVSAPKAGADPFAAMDAGTPQQNAVAAAKAAPVPADAPF